MQLMQLHIIASKIIIILNNMSTAAIQYLQTTWLSNDSGTEMKTHRLRNYPTTMELNLIYKLKQRGTTSQVRTSVSLPT